MDRRKLLYCGGFVFDFYRDNYLTIKSAALTIFRRRLGLPKTLSKYDILCLINNLQSLTGNLWKIVPQV